MPQRMTFTFVFNVCYLLNMDCEIMQMPILMSLRLDSKLSIQLCSKWRLLYDLIPICLNHNVLCIYMYSPSIEYQRVCPSKPSTALSRTTMVPTSSVSERGMVTGFFMNCGAEEDSTGQGSAWKRTRADARCCSGRPLSIARTWTMKDRLNLVAVISWFSFQMP